MGLFSNVRRKAWVELPEELVRRRPPIPVSVLSPFLTLPSPGLEGSRVNQEKVERSEKPSSRTCPAKSRGPGNRGESYSASWLGIQ